MNLGGAVLFLDRDRGLAGPAAEIIKARFHRLRLALDFDLLDIRRIDRKHAFNALTVAETANGESFMDAVALPRDHDAGENLHALLVTFADLRVYAHTVADLERRSVFFHLTGGDFLDDRVHGS